MEDPLFTASMSSTDLPWIDRPRQRLEIGRVMKKRSARAGKNKRDLFKETEGDRIAAEVRRRANKLTPEQRAEYVRRGMVRIYGGQWPKEATRAGH